MKLNNEVVKTDPMSFEVARTLIFLAIGMSVTLIASNLAALKIWRLAVPYLAGAPDLVLASHFEIARSALRALDLQTFGDAAQAILANTVAWLEVPVDAGIFLFPVSYIVGDLLVEIYGKKSQT